MCIPVRFRAMRLVYRVALGTAVLLVAAAASGCGTASTTTALHTKTERPRTTAIRIYAPFGASEDPVVPVSRTVGGYCWTSSEAADRSDAWRCTTGNDIYDPCFAANHAAHFVLCPEGGPWGKAMHMNLTRELPSLEPPTPKPSPTNEPAWAVELTGGARCVLLEGAGTLLANLRENYKCSNGVTLYGDANHASEPWTIFGRQGSARQLTPETVAAMWY